CQHSVCQHGIATVMERSSDGGRLTAHAHFSACFVTMQLVVVLSAICIALCAADVYMHNPRGSNNRLNEQSANRNNGNRMFNSQNNNRGGYNKGDNST